MHARVALQVYACFEACVINESRCSVSRVFPPAGSGGGSGTSKAVNPYHVSYAPVSAQDSELQSLSSDAHTDDTMSLTDSSV